MEQVKNLLLKDITEYRDDLFSDFVRAMIALGVEEDGLALYLTELMVRGKGEENRVFIERIVIDIEISDEQIDYTLNVKYMLRRIAGINKYVMIFCWYKINYPEIYKN